MAFVTIGIGIGTTLTFVSIIVIQLTSVPSARATVTGTTGKTPYLNQSSNLNRDYEQALTPSISCSKVVSLSR